MPTGKQYQQNCRKIVTEASKKHARMEEREEAMNIKWLKEQERRKNLRFMTNELNFQENQFHY